MIRLIADGHLSHKLIDACNRIEPAFPIGHVSNWQSGRYRTAKDPALLTALHQHNLIIVTCDRRSMAMHASDLTRAGMGHSGVIIFRPGVVQSDYGKQSRLLVELWREAADWDWSDRIQYLPR